MYSVSYIFESAQINSQVQLCTEVPYKFLDQVRLNDIYWSPKIDGVRCWVVISKRTIPHGQGFKKIADFKYLSRNNKEFGNFTKFNDDIMKICHTLNRKHNIKYPIIIDTEVSSRNQSFSSVMTQLRRINNMNPDLFVMNMFDLVVPRVSFDKRHELLSKAIKENKRDIKDIKLLPYKPFKGDIEDLYQLRDEMIDKYGYEGIILIDKNSNYQYKRTTKCLKMKREYTIDLKIVDVKLGEQGTRWEGVVSAIVCEFDGQKVNISGQINAKTRKQWAQNPPIGSYAEIKYKEITDKGKLREPVFVRLREDK